MSFQSAANRLAARTMRVLGNEVVIGLFSGCGQLMAPTEELINGNVISTGWELKYQMADFPVVNRGDVVVVDGVVYNARTDGTITGDLATGIVPLERDDVQGPVEYIIDGNG